MFVFLFVPIHHPLHLGSFPSPNSYGPGGIIVTAFSFHPPGEKGMQIMLTNPWHTFGHGDWLSDGHVKKGIPWMGF